MHDQIGLGVQFWFDQASSDWINLSLRLHISRDVSLDRSTAFSMFCIKKYVIGFIPSKNWKDEKSTQIISAKQKISISLLFDEVSSAAAKPAYKFHVINITICSTTAEWWGSQQSPGEMLTTLSTLQSSSCLPGLDVLWPFKCHLGCSGLAVPMQ